MKFVPQLKWKQLIEKIHEQNNISNFSVSFNTKYLKINKTLLANVTNDNTNRKKAWNSVGSFLYFIKYFACHKLLEISSNGVIWIGFLSTKLSVWKCSNDTFIKNKVFENTNEKTQLIFLWKWSVKFYLTMNLVKKFENVLSRWKNIKVSEFIYFNWMCSWRISRFFLIKSSSNS